MVPVNYNTQYDFIDSKETKDFVLTWDTGKFCNFDCTYCYDLHDINARFKSLKELKKTVDFIEEYLSIIMKHRVNKSVSLVLTGGEPTANKNFFELARHIRERMDRWDYKTQFILTTNGSWATDKCSEIVSVFDNITVSYHCESTPSMKERVRANILKLKELGAKFKVNLMNHPYEPYWQESLMVADMLEDNNIKFFPRVIRQVSPPYTEEQSQWFADYWNTDIKTVDYEDSYLDNQDTNQVNDKNREYKKTTKVQTEGGNKAICGRNCCSGYNLDTSCGTTKYVNDLNFKNWYCGVNWFFLHIESQTDSIFHHQTCQAQFGQSHGPIGKISEYQKVIEQYKYYSENGFPTLQCSKQSCNCGLCATKAFNKAKFDNMMKDHINVIY